MSSRLGARCADTPKAGQSSRRRDRLRYILLRAITGKAREVDRRVIKSPAIPSAKNAAQVEHQGFAPRDEFAPDRPQPLS